MLKENLTRQHDNVFLDQLPFIQGIADALPDMFYLLDLVQKKIIYANQRGLDLLGKNMEDLGEVDSNFFASVVYHEDRLAFNEHLNHLFSASHDDVAELTFRLVHASGKILWVRTRRTIYKRDAHGYPTHAISVSQDISKEKELQEIRAQLENDKRELEAEKQAEIFRTILSTQEEERRRISESLHNGLGQLLYGIKLNLSGLDIKTALKNPSNFEKNHQYASDLLEEGIKETRRISHELVPRVLQDFGIEAAIEDACHKVECNISFSRAFHGLDLLKPSMATAVFRSIQELILNICKHSRARNATIGLRVSKNLVEIKVSDNGIGFDIEITAHNGIGLKSLKHKVRLLKGTLDIKSSPARGTCVTINLPQPDTI